MKKKLEHPFSYDQSSIETKKTVGLWHRTAGFARATIERVSDSMMHAAEVDRKIQEEKNRVHERFDHYQTPIF